MWKRTIHKSVRVYKIIGNSHIKLKQVPYRVSSKPRSLVLRAESNRNYLFICIHFPSNKWFFRCCPTNNSSRRSFPGVWMIVCSAAWTMPWNWWRQDSQTHMTKRSAILLILLSCNWLLRLLCYCKGARKLNEENGFLLSPVVEVGIEYIMKKLPLDSKKVMLL